MTRKTKEELLNEGERFLENIFASIQDGIGIIDGDMNIIMVNKTIESWYPYAVPLIGKKCYEAYHGRKERCEQCPAQETLKSGKSDYKIISKHGIGGKEVGWLEIYSYPLTDTKTGQLRGVIEYVRDITERKLAEESQRRAEERFRLAFNNAPIGMAIVGLDESILLVNPTLCRILGYTEAELTSRKVSDISHPDDFEKEAEYKRMSIEGVLESFQIVKRYIHADGHSVIGELSVSLVKDALGNPLYHIGQMEDITERKRMEMELKQSEEKYRLLIENIHEGVFVIQDARIVFANQAFAEIAGYKIEEIIGTDFYHFVAPDDLEMVKDRYYRRQRGEDVPDEYEFHALRMDGEKTLVKMKVGIVMYSGRVASMGIVEDITELKRAEEFIKQSEEKYRNLVELTTDIIYMTDKDRKHIFMNDAGYRILEALPGDVIGHHWSECIYPDDREKSFKKFREKMVKGIDVFDFENRYFSKSGKAINVLHNVRVLRNEKGEVIGTQGIARDITERLRIEKSLKLFSEAIESAPDGIQIVDPEGHIKYSNKAFEKIYGFSQDELTGKNVRLLNVDPEIAGKIIIPGTIEKGSWTGELIVRHKDGHEFPIWLTTSLVKDETGAPIAMVGIIRDITERKRAEEILRLSNLVVENSQTVLFKLKAQEGWPVEFVSNNVVQFGYRAEDFLSGALLYTSIIHPDDLERVSREVREHSKDGDDRFQQEYRIIAKNGAIHWIDDRKVIERKWDGQITNYQVIIIDITERKHAEEAIRKNNLELEVSNRTKELFIDIMHHDLLNPLTVANGYVEIFLEDETNLRKKSYLETIKRNLVKGMELIDNATKFSKIESMSDIEFKDLDLKIVIGEAAANLTPLAVSSGMIIENKIKGSMPARANKIIEDVFINIITNAIKYAPEGKKIVVEGKDRGKSWSVRVKDFGAGIKDAEKTLVFERFHREEKKGVKGSGLGLAIAGKIVELHKGRIWVEDNPEGGAVFVVEIPKR